MIDLYSTKTQFSLVMQWLILGFVKRKHVFSVLTKLNLTSLFTLKNSMKLDLFCLFVCFVALRPKSTVMVIAGRSVHLTTLFPGQACTSGLPVIRAHTFACN